MNDKLTWAEFADKYKPKDGDVRVLWPAIPEPDGSYEVPE